MDFLITIGIILALIGTIMIWKLKEPLQTSDWLLISILLTFVIKFVLDELFQLTGNIVLPSIAGLIGASSILSCAWYIKYLTRTNEHFSKKELLSYLPPLLLILLILSLLPLNTLSAVFNFASIFVVGLSLTLIFYYFYFCICMLQKHKQLIRDYYSGESGDLTVNWMVVIISLQITEFVVKLLLIGIMSNYRTPQTEMITNEYCFIIETFLLVVLGVWQKSIPVFSAPAIAKGQVVLENTDLPYYREKLEKFMSAEKPYLDPELTLEKLSELVKIRKVLLSETLNKGLDKNFFTYIKEHRIRHVEQLLNDKKTNHQTILDLAYQSGFNSKTGFNRAFKEVTGKTPTDDLRR
jgi:AraC-like DNA-binding protein